MTTIRELPIVKVLHLQDFIHAYGEQPFEYDEGESFVMPPQLPISGETNAHFYRLLDDVVRQQQLGRVFIEVPFVLTLDKTNWVRGSRTPDTLFYTTERMTKIMQDSEWYLKPLIGAPDFVAEVLSPTDETGAVQQKIAGYLRDGVRLVWVIEPLAKSLTIHIPQQPIQTFTDGQTFLTLSPVIPNFQVRLQDLWVI